MEAIASLSEKEKIVIVADTYMDMTQKQIGEEILGLTESRVSQIYTEARIKMLRYFKNHDFEGLD